MFAFRVISVCLALLTGWPVSSPAWYMRVIGRDDSPAAQAEKLRVRDAALSACPDNALGLPFALPAIRREAENAAPCDVTLRLWAPAGEEKARPTLYITVGAGQGHNWWGVLYDGALRMAQAEETEEEPARDAEPEFIWPLWEWLLGLLGM